MHNVGWQQALGCITDCGCFTASGINTLYSACTIAGLDWWTGLGFSLIKDSTAVYLQAVNINNTMVNTHQYIVTPMGTSVNTHSLIYVLCRIQPTTTFVEVY